MTLFFKGMVMLTLNDFKKHKEYLLEQIKNLEKQLQQTEINISNFNKAKQNSSKNKDALVEDWVINNIKVGDIVKISSSAHETIKKVISVNYKYKSITMGDIDRKFVQIKKYARKPMLMIVDNKEEFRKSIPMYGVFNYTPKVILGYFEDDGTSHWKYVSIKKDILK